MTKIVEWCNRNIQEKKQLKPIELVKIITSEHIHSIQTKPDHWDFISLISSNNTSSYDLIACRGEDGLNVYYWGHWNDGVL